MPVLAPDSARGGTAVCDESHHARRRCRRQTAAPAREGACGRSSRDHRARVRKKIVVIVELQDPLAGRQFHGPVDVPGQTQRRPVGDVPVPARPVAQEPPHHLGAGVVGDPSDTVTSTCSTTDGVARRTQPSARSSSSGRCLVGMAIDSLGRAGVFRPRARASGSSSVPGIASVLTSIVSVRAVRPPARLPAAARPAVPGRRVGGCGRSAGTEDPRTPW
jgi:hypothetical protein